MLFRRVYAEFFSRRHIKSTHCLRESKRSCRSCACAPGASEPYVADNTDKKLADGGFLAAGLAIPAICVAVWLAFTFLLFFICETRSRRIKRCTYFEIQKSAAILSRYGGKISADTGGIQRRLYIIPYDEMKLSVKKGRLVFTGKIRCYEGDSDRLGYHIRQGKPEFDSWWLNENGFRKYPR